jgi:hypothetical protein
MSVHLVGESLTPSRPMFGQCLESEAPKSTRKESVHNANADARASNLCGGRLGHVTNATYPRNINIQLFPFRAARREHSTILLWEVPLLGSGHCYIICAGF